jgi:hypothetical protein
LNAFRSMFRLVNEVNRWEKLKKDQLQLFQ